MLNALIAWSARNKFLVVILTLFITLAVLALNILARVFFREKVRA